MKKLVTILAFGLLWQCSFSQNYVIGNDSLTFQITELKNETNDSIVGFKLKIINLAKQSIAIGIESEGSKDILVRNSLPTASCYTYSFENEIFLIAGGRRIAINEPLREWIDLMPVRSGDTIQITSHVWKIGIGQVKLSINEYQRLKKNFFLEYLPSFDKTAIEYNQFKKTKRLIFLTLNE